VPVASGDVPRHTTFQFTADPSAEQKRALARHEGAARFAFNQCLRLHLDARHRSRAAHDDDDQGDAGAVVRVPWSGFDFINSFNAWKRSEHAGRRFVVNAAGDAELEVTGLAWRCEVSAQVFEEAAVDLGKALKAWTDSRRGKRAGRAAGHPRFKKKTNRGSFLMRNKVTKTKAGKRSSILVGERMPRSVTLPGIGVVRVHDDTRRLRRMLAAGRARILFATVSRRAGRWRISLNVQAADLHPALQHPTRDAGDRGGWVGVDRGLLIPVVAATAEGAQTVRVDVAPKATRAAQPTTRRLSRAVSRKKKGSAHRRKAVAHLGQHHDKIRNRRQHFLHQVSNLLVKTHDRLILEDLNVTGMLANHHLAAAISDAAWGELARQIGYKATWRGGTVLTAARWFPSSKTCSACGVVKPTLTLAERVFTCDACGISLDRDLNAAVNLATWGEQHHSQVPDPEARGWVTNAHRQDGPGPRPGASGTSLEDVGTGYAPAA